MIVGSWQLMFVSAGVVTVQINPREDAKAIALKHAGVSEKNIFVLDIEKEKGRF